MELVKVGLLLEQGGQPSLGAQAAGDGNRSSSECWASRCEGHYCRSSDHSRRIRLVARAAVDLLGLTGTSRAAMLRRGLSPVMSRAVPIVVCALTRSGSWCDPSAIARSPMGVRGSRRHRSWTHPTRFGVPGISDCGWRHPGSWSHTFAIARSPTIDRGVTQHCRHSHPCNQGSGRMRRLPHDLAGKLIQLAPGWNPLCSW